MNRKKSIGVVFFTSVLIITLLVVTKLLIHDVIASTCSSVVTSVSFDTQSFMCTISASSGTDIICGIKSDQNGYPQNCPWQSGLHFQCPKSAFSGVAKVYVGGLYNKQGTSCYNDWSGSALWKEFVTGTVQPQPSVPANNACDAKSIYNACTSAPKHTSGCAYNDGAQIASAKGWYYCGGDDYWRGPFADETRCGQCATGTIQQPPPATSPAAAPPAQAPASNPAPPLNSPDTTAPVDFAQPAAPLAPSVESPAADTQPPAPEAPAAQPPVVVPPAVVPEKPVITVPPVNPAVTISSTALAKINHLTSLANNRYKIVLATHENIYATWKDQGYIGASNPNDSINVLTSPSDPIVKHLFDNKFLATAHEDLIESRNCGNFPNCQFWRVEFLVTRTDTIINEVFNHEAIHNMQSANDGNLAEHLNFGSNIDLNKAYLYLIEGSATKKAGIDSGMYWYRSYVAFFEELQIWANKNGYSSQFAAAIDGDWNAFNNLYNAYEEKSGTSMHTLLLKYHT